MIGWFCPQLAPMVHPAHANSIDVRIPSALWQGFWTWGFGPWLLFKIRGIHDIHRWRLQTTLVIIFK
jgi:hypothetical protein